MIIDILGVMFWAFIALLMCVAGYEVWHVWREL